MTEKEVIDKLAADFDMPRARAYRVVEIARWIGIKAEPLPSGYVTVIFDQATRSYEIEDHTKGKVTSNVAQAQHEA